MYACAIVYLIFFNKTAKYKTSSSSFFLYKANIKKINVTRSFDGLPFKESHYTYIQAPQCKYIQNTWPITKL